MKPQLTFLLLLLIIVSCNNNEKICHITGSLENAPDTTTLFLVDWENKSLFDSIQIIDGVIDYEFAIKGPTYFVLHNERNRFDFRDRKFIWLEPSEISVNGNFEFLKNLNIEGSASQTEFEKYTLLVDNATKQINKLKEQIHFKSNEEKRKDTIIIESLQEKLSDSIVSYMLNRPNSFVTLSSLHEECYMAFRHLNKEQINRVYEHLSEDLKVLNQGTEIKKYIELPEHPKLGDIAPEIVQTTMNGDTIRLSDYRGKYVLIDFWSSDCGPCRASHKWLKRIYKKYNPKGFEILGVSGDSNKNSWIKAINQDSVTWTNVSDLKGWKNDVFLLYDVKFIPQNFLINPEGKIINYRLCSESYTDNELGKIFKD